MTTKLDVYKQTDKLLEKAAKKVVKDLEHHFKTDGWDLRWTFLVEELFYQAYGKHLETYLLAELAKVRNYKLTFKDNVMLTKTRKKLNNAFMINSTVTVNGRLNAIPSVKPTNSTNNRKRKRTSNCSD